MRCIRRDIRKEWFVFILHLLDPSHPGGEKQVGAITLGLYEGTIVPNGRVEILVTWRIGARALEGLPNTTGSVNEGFVEAPLVRLVRFLVSQVPFSEDSRNVTRLGQNLRKRHRA